MIVLVCYRVIIRVKYSIIILDVDRGAHPHLADDRPDEVAFLYNLTVVSYYSIPIFDLTKVHFYTT